MSYILDALTKSQRERERATVPSLGAAFAVPDPGARRQDLWPRAAFAAAVVAGAVAVYAVLARTTPLPGLPAGAATPAEPAARQTPAPSPPAALGQAAPVAAVAAPLPHAAVQAPAPARSEAPIADVAPAAAAVPAAPAELFVGAKETAGATVKELPPAAAATATAAEAAEKLPPHLAALRSDLLELKAREERRAAERAAARATEPTLHSEADGNESKRPADGPGPLAPDSVVRLPPKLSQLSARARQEIPALELNAHVYAQEPAERMAIINMRRYQEGDRTVEGATVESITAEGAELRFAEHRFRLTVPWRR